MATAPAKEPGTALVLDCREVNYTPLGESNPTRLTVGMVRMFLAAPSKSGKKPGDIDVVKFMKLCESRALNPWVGDAFLLGYDTINGTQWSLITAIQALRKRAEASEHYDGCECGVIVRVEGGDKEYRTGTIVEDGEKLIGGWAQVNRKDRTVPEYRTVKFATYDSGQSRWKKDPGGMICKVAEASALRAAFPSDLGGLYLRDEMGENDSPSQVVEAPTSGVAGLRAKLAPVAEKPDEEPSQEVPDEQEGIDPPHQDDDAIQGAGDYQWGSDGNPPTRPDHEELT